MNWREAFIKQAAADNIIRQQLNESRAAYSHQLHYLQMVSEKLAKGLLANPNDVNAPATVHRAFVRLLQSIKGQPHIRRHLGYPDSRVFRNFVNALLDEANNIEGLAPALAGTTQPNPEYPWRDLGTGEIQVPVDYAFTLFDPFNPKMVQLESLITQLLRYAD